MSITAEIREKGGGDARKIIDKVTINRQIHMVNVDVGLSISSSNAQRRCVF